MTYSARAEIGAARFASPPSYAATLGLCTNGSEPASAISSAVSVSSCAKALAKTEPSGTAMPLGGANLKVVFPRAKGEGPKEVRWDVRSAVSSIDNRARERSAMEHARTLQRSTLTCLLRQVYRSLSTEFQLSGYVGNVRGETLGGYEGKHGWSHCGQFAIASGAKLPFGVCVRTTFKGGSARGRA